MKDKTESFLPLKEVRILDICYNRLCFFFLLPVFSEERNVKLAFSLTLLLTWVVFTHCLVILFLLRYISLSLSLVSWCIFPNKWLSEWANSESHRWTGCTLELADGDLRQEDKSLSDCWVTGESRLGGLWSKHTLLGVWGEEGSNYAFGWMERWTRLPESLLWGGTEQAGPLEQSCSHPCQGIWKHQGTVRDFETSCFQTHSVNSCLLTFMFSSSLCARKTSYNQAEWHLNVTTYCPFDLKGKWEGLVIPGLEVGVFCLSPAPQHQQ